MECKYLDNNHCLLVQELTSLPSPTSESTCNTCLKSPTRINLVTIGLANKISPDMTYDISHLGSGFGTRLHNLISPYLSEVEDCDCETHKDILDLWTPEYIRKNIDRVVQWLADSARKRRIPFSYRITRLVLLSLLYQSGPSP